jgi:hypothetical protein
MAAKEKAKELVEKYHALEQCNNHSDLVLDGNICAHLAKQCALIAVEQAMEGYFWETPNYKYWQQVKDEIEKL